LHEGKAPVAVRLAPVTERTREAGTVLSLAVAAYLRLIEASSDARCRGACSASGCDL